MRDFIHFDNFIDLNYEFVAIIILDVSGSGRRGRPAQPTNRPRAAAQRPAPVPTSEPNQVPEQTPSSQLATAAEADSNNPNETGTNIVKSY